jgi:hypothetical protein
VVVTLRIGNSPASSLSDLSAKREYHEGSVLLYDE